MTPRASTIKLKVAKRGSRISCLTGGDGEEIQDIFAVFEGNIVSIDRQYNYHAKLGLKSIQFAQIFKGYISNDTGTISAETNIQNLI